MPIVVITGFGSVIINDTRTFGITGETGLFIDGEAVSDASGFTWLVSHLGGDERLAKLMMAIAGENIAVGVAGAAFVAYLSSIVSKGYSAVQYALLSSLTLLIGTLGRGALGQMLEERGYFDVFVLTTLIGMFAVVLCIVEWVRQARLARASD